MSESRTNALVLQIGQLKEHHLRQRFEDAPLRPSAPSEKLGAQFGSNKHTLPPGTVRSSTEVPGRSRSARPMLCPYRCHPSGCGRGLRSGCASDRGGRPGRSRGHARRPSGSTSPRPGSAGRRRCGAPTPPPGEHNGFCDGVGYTRRGCGLHEEGYGSPLGARTGYI